MGSGGPPSTSIFFSFEPAKNASMRLSGAQNGQLAPSVPGSALASGESSARTQIRTASSSPAARNVMRRPSGEMASDGTSGSTKRVNCGVLAICIQVARGGFVLSRNHALPAAIVASNQATCSRCRFRAATGAATPACDPASAIQRSSRRR
jgi:hypothetical protein